MEMFLSVVVLSILGVAISAVLFAAATRNERSQQRDETRGTVIIPAARFFAEHPQARPEIPIEALLLQIEHHVRLEQAAAASFVNVPSRDLLHSRTASPLIH